MFWTSVVSAFRMDINVATVVLLHAVSVGVSQAFFV